MEKNSNSSQRQPSLVRRLRDSIMEESLALGILLRAEWRRGLLICCGISILMFFSRPLPPRDVYLAVGQEGSGFEILGNKLVPYFAEEGIRLHLVNTRGSVENLTEVADRNTAVNAAFMIGGIAEKGKFPNLYSLGSVEYVPLWFFYRGQESPEEGAFTHFSSKRVSVGRTGSAGEIMLKKLLDLHGLALDGRENFLNISNQEATQKLLDGEIDAACIMEGIGSPNVQKLLQRKDIHILNFSFSPAYVKKLPFLKSVVIPKGSLDLTEPRPARDIQLLASTATLLVEKDMHPVIQQIFLLGADKISNELDQFFADPDVFPFYSDSSVALSPVANKFYENGPPAFKDSLPLWLINYFDRIWFMLLGILAVAYPLFRFFPRYSRTRSIVLITEAYQDLRRIEKNVTSDQCVEDLYLRMDQLNELEASIRESRIIAGELNRYFIIKNAINALRLHTTSRIAKLKADV